MSKPKIAVILDEMSIGGIPAACISFLKAIEDVADVTMVLESDKGVFTSKIPSKVKIEVKPSESVSQTFSDLFKKRKYFKYLMSAFKYKFYAKTDHWIKASTVANECKNPLLDETFDCAIAYHGMNAAQMNRTLYQIKAKKKITWIQGDHAFEDKYKKDAEEVYQKFDHIFCVSNVTKKRFLSDFPSVSDKTSVYYVHMDVDEIIAKSKAEQIQFAKDKINLVTVGRISQEKGQDLVPGVAKILIDRGYDINWYLVGDGADRARIEELVIREGVENNVIFAGNQPNPFPYIAACDLYVQPSYTEGFGMTIFEAIILGKTVVATDVGGANELLRDSEDLLFVQPTSKDIADGIERMLTDEALRNHIIQNISNRDFSNNKEVEKLISMI